MRLAILHRVKKLLPSVREDLEIDIVIVQNKTLFPYLSEEGPAARYPLNLKPVQQRSNEVTQKQ